MKTKRRDPLEPTVYLRSIDDPTYSRCEREYWAEHNRQKLLKRFPQRSILGFDDPIALAAWYRTELESANLRSAEKDRYVIEAIKLFSDYPLELKVSLNPPQFNNEAERLGAATLFVIGLLRSSVLGGNFSERKNAKSRLEKILKGIRPDTRGKKMKTAHPLLIQQFYWGELFRLYHVRETLRSSQRNVHLKVKMASENYGLSVELIREFWGLDENDAPYRQPLATLQEMARELTARQFKLTLHRVSNVLASKLVLGK